MIHAILKLEDKSSVETNLRLTFVTKIQESEALIQKY